MGNNLPAKPVPLGSNASNSPVTAPPIGDPTVLRVVKTVVNTATNPHTRRAYSAALFGFLRWYESVGKPGFTITTITAYKGFLVASDLSPSTINLKLSAIRTLSREFGEQGLLDPINVIKISQISGLTPSNSRVTSWLTREQAQCLINAPDTLTLKGLRDRAILALMIGCGLNRSEISDLNFENIKQVQGRWAIADLMGKGNRKRSVPMPPWAKVALDGWINALEEIAIPPIPTQRIFRAINRGDRLAGERKTTDKRTSDGFMSSQAISDVLSTYAIELGYKNINTQATRRTFAKLARKGGAEINQIQLSLGHSNYKTTESFLETKQNFNDAPADRLGINLEP